MPTITDKKGCARIVLFFAAQPLPMIRREPAGWVRWEQAKALLQNCVAPGAISGLKALGFSIGGGGGGGGGGKESCTMYSRCLMHGLVHHAIMADMCLLV